MSQLFFDASALMSSLRLRLFKNICVLDSKKALKPTFIFCLTAALSLTSCKTLPDPSQTLSTDERPDISEDRSQVKFTYGTKEFAILKASDLKINFYSKTKNDSENIREMSGRSIRYVYQHPSNQSFAVAVEFSEPDAKPLSMVFVGYPSALDKISAVGYYQSVKRNQPGSKKLRAMHEIMNLFFDAKNQLHVVQADESGNSSELVFGPDFQFLSCESLKAQIKGVSLCEIDPEIP